MHKEQISELVMAWMSNQAPAAARKRRRRAVAREGGQGRGSWRHAAKHCGAHRGSTAGALRSSLCEWKLWIPPLRQVLGGDQWAKAEDDVPDQLRSARGARRGLDGIDLTELGRSAGVVERKGFGS